MRALLEALARAPAAAIAAVLAAVVLGAGLTGFGIAELTRGDGEGATTAAPARTAEGPSVVAGEEQEGAQQPEAPAEEQAPAEEEPATEPAAPSGAGGVPIWPEALTAHTVVLVTTSDRAAAFRVAKAARSTGLEAGLLPSDPYDLGTGLWIVYSGRFTTAEGAQRQASDLAERYPGAYPQLIQSSQ
jgi:hypothetical protein